MRFCVRSSFVRRAVRVRSCLALGAVLGLLLVGCQKRDEIQRYTVKKLPRAERPAVPETPPPRGMPAGHGQTSSERLLGAIAPHGSTFWVFKLAGPKDLASAQMEEFLSLVQSLKFSGDEDSTPEWTLPEGWSEQKDSEKTSTRFATLLAKQGDDELPVSVTRLPFPPDRPTEGVPLMIVNLWCEQLGLAEKTPADLKAEEQPKGAEVQLLDVNGMQVTLVNFLAAETPARSAPVASREPSRGQPKWTVPEGWKDAPGNQFSVAAFAVTDGKQAIKTTVSRAGGDLLGNLNRWRDQVKLEPWSADEAAKSAKKLTVDGHEGTFVDFVGVDKNTSKPMCLIGAIVPQGDSAWFFKLTGDVELAQREKANFEAFVQSVKFEK